MIFLDSNHESLSVMLPIPISKDLSLTLVGGWSSDLLEEELSWIETMLPTESIGTRSKRTNCAVESGDDAQLGLRRFPPMDLAVIGDTLP
jgi:hypothetical protein